MTSPGRVRSPRPLPDEWVAAVYLVAGVVLLERLPVTYPRRAIFLADLQLASLIVLVALIVISSAWLVRRRTGRPSPVGLADRPSRTAV